jgi:hypothetical protein
MIYEILVRPSYNKLMTSDHLIWVDSQMPTRFFEQWLRDHALLDGSGRSPVVRWGIVQTQRPAHFQLATQEHELTQRIAQLMSGAAHLGELPVSARDPAQMKSPVFLAA